MASRRLLLMCVVGSFGLLAVASFCGVAAGALGLITGMVQPFSGSESLPAPPDRALYEAAAATCPGLPWPVLAAIGSIESDNGRSLAPGVHSGANQAGAEVIYRWIGGLGHVRDWVLGRRACGVSARCEARGAGGDGHTRSLGCPGYDGLLSGVACGVSF